MNIVAASTEATEGFEQHRKVLLIIKPACKSDHDFVVADAPLPAEFLAPLRVRRVCVDIYSVVDNLVSLHRQMRFAHVVVPNSLRDADNTIAPARHNPRPCVLPRPEASLRHVNGMNQIPHPGQPGGDTPHKIGVKKMRVEQIDPLSPKQFRHPGKNGKIEFISRVQYGNADARLLEPPSHRPAAKSGHLHVEPLAVKPQRQFINASLGPRRLKFGNQLAYPQTLHRDNVPSLTPSALEKSARPRYIPLTMNEKLTTDKAMILARGLGTRMQKQADDVKLDAATSDLAAKGAKGLITVGAGRPFLDYSLQALMDTGIRDICLIVAPGTSMLRNYYEAVGERLPDTRISFAVQDEPLGTAHAVASGRQWADGKPFIVVNCDNFYTPEAIRALITSAVPATVAFEREALIANSNIPADRIRRFAVIDFDQSGCLRKIIEKPDNPDDYALDGKLYVSMNCFCFTTEIFDACDAIEPNPVRKEYELPTAVQYTIEQMGLTYQAVKCTEGVLDMTGRDDIESVRRLLADHEVRFDAPEKKE